MDYWSNYGPDLGVRVKHNVLIEGFEHLGPLETLVECFGGPKGTIVVTDFEDIASEADNLVSAGYGFSCFDQKAAVYSREGAISVLQDWEWACDGPAPDWYDHDWTEPDEDP
jgi:hypothetical protein